MAAEADVALLLLQRLAIGDADHFLDQVDAGDHLGDRMFDLDARVHLDEIEAAIFVQEFEGAGAARSEEHTSEPQSLMRLSYAVFCLKTKNIIHLYLHPT